MSLSWELFSVFNVISLLILYATLIPYCVIQELKRQNHGRFIIYQLSSLILGYSVTFALNVIFLLQKQTPVIGHFIFFFCFGHGYIVQFSLLAASAWLNVMFFGVWRETRWLRSGRRQLHFDRGRKCFDVIDTLYGWGLPLTIMLITCASNVFRLLPYDETFVVGKPGAITCFFSSEMSAAWIVYIGPLLALMLVNLVLILMVGHKLFINFKEVETLMPQIVTSETNYKNRESLCKERLLMYSEVFLVLCGHTLVMTVLPDSKELWYIYAICFTLTSLLLFVIYICSPAALGPVKIWMCPSEPPLAPSDTTVSPSTSVIMSPFDNPHLETRPIE